MTDRSFDPATWNAFLMEGQEANVARDPRNLRGLNLRSAAERRLSTGDFVNYSGNLTDDDMTDLEAMAQQEPAFKPERRIKYKTYDAQGNPTESEVVLPSEQGRPRSLGASFLAKARKAGQDRRMEKAAEIEAKKAADASALKIKEANEAARLERERKQNDIDLAAKTPQGMLDIGKANLGLQGLKAEEEKFKPVSEAEINSLPQQYKAMYLASVDGGKVPRVALGEARDAWNQRKRGVVNVITPRMMSSDLTTEEMQDIQATIAAEGLTQDDIGPYQQRMLSKAGDFANNSKARDNKSYQEAFKYISPNLNAVKQSMSSNWLYLSDEDKDNIRSLVTEMIADIDAMQIKQVIKDNLKAKIRAELESGAKSSSTFFGDFGIGGGGHVGQHMSNIPWYMGGQ